MKIGGHAQSRLGMGLAQHHRSGQSRQHLVQAKPAIKPVCGFRQIQARVLALLDRVVGQRTAADDVEGVCMSTGK